MSAATQQSLRGKTAVVLRAAGRDNMGQAIASRFADEGARVVVAGRHPGELDRFAAAIGGASALCDITDKGPLEALAVFAKAWGGSLDIAVSGQNLQVNGGLTLRRNPSGAEMQACVVDATGAGR
jgi:NAD(P)-dependent dehydrogenase (short-subunit alcohol dehydrogenase family)